MVKQETKASPKAMTFAVSCQQIYCTTLTVLTNKSAKHAIQDMPRSRTHLLLRLCNVELFNEPTQEEDKCSHSFSCRFSLLFYGSTIYV